MDIRKLGPDIVVSIKSVGKGPQQDDFMIQLDVWCVRAIPFLFSVALPQKRALIYQRKRNRMI